MKIFTYSLLFISLFSVSEKTSAQGQYLPLGPASTPGVNNAVYSIVPVPSSNDVYVGGNFTFAGGVATHYVVKLTDATHSGLGTFTNLAANANQGGMDNTVNSLTYFNGSLYAAGTFVNSDSLGIMNTTWGVAKWTGTYWASLGGGFPHGAGMYSLAVYNSNLYAGGYISETFSLQRGIAMWNGSAWVTVGASGVPGVRGAAGYHVSAMQVFNGNLYVGGVFDTASTVVAHNIAMWNGSTWSAVGTGTNGEVKAFTVIGTTLYAGGSFTTINGVSAKHIAKFDGTTWTALANGLDNTVNGLGSYYNELYAVGEFLTSATTTDSMKHIARFKNGTTWKPVWGGTGVIGLDNHGYCLGYNSFNTTLYVGGFYGSAGNIAGANSIVKLYYNSIGINEIINDDALNVYPNPSDGNVIMEWKNSYKKLLVEVFSMEGKNVYSLNEQSVINQTLNLNLSTLPRGIYIAKFTTEDGTRVKKLVIE